MTDANDIKLSPCPFCGTDAELNTASNAKDWWTLGCPNVACFVSPQAQSDNLDQLVGGWNRRVYEVGP